MTIAKQMEIRENIKKYFDAACEGDVIYVPRKQQKNVVILSEQEYSRLSKYAQIYDTYHSEPAALQTKKTLSSHKPAIQTGSVLTDNLIKLDTIGELKDNWNGNGAPSFPAELIEKVRHLLKELPIQPEIFPTALQTIQLEYDNSRHDHMEIEISLSDTTEVFTVPYFGEDHTEEIPSDITSIRERVENFYG